jgi:hypothetical protein
VFLVVVHQGNGQVVALDTVNRRATHAELSPVADAHLRDLDVV